jgi:hypothetical protein
MKLNLKKKPFPSKKPSSISPSMEMIGKMIGKGKK